VAGRRVGPGTAPPGSQVRTAAVEGPSPSIGLTPILSTRMYARPSSAQRVISSLRVDASDQYEAARNSPRSTLTLTTNPIPKLDD